MSAPQKFRDLPAALAAYRAGTCRRWVEVDGWQIDLVQAAEPSKVARPDDDRQPLLISQWASADREAHDYTAAHNIAAELSQAVEVLPPLAEPAIAAPHPDDASAYRCPWCSRPWDGAK